MSASSIEKQINVLALTRHDRLAADSRLRTLQYIPYLESNGIRVTVSPLLSNSYLLKHYNWQKNLYGSIIPGYIKRLKVLLGLKKYDLIWIEKELFPMFPAVLEKVIVKIKTPYIVDYDDAVFHNYDLNRNKFVRYVLGQKIDEVMKHASAVIVCNDYLEQRAREAGAKKVLRMPTVVDIDRYEKKKNTDNPGSSNEKFTLGWIGTPRSEQNFGAVRETLRVFCSKYPSKILIIGGTGKFLDVLPYEIRRWSEDDEVKNLHNFDVGIMPLFDAPMQRGKCGYKLIQYMACGLPVVASAVGINTSIIKHEYNGFLVKSHKDWIDALTRLYNDKPLRITMGERGRRLVEKEYCLQVTSRGLKRLIEEICYNS